MIEKESNDLKYDLKIWKKFLKYLKPFKKEMSIVGFSMILIASIDVILPYMTMIAIDEYIVPGTMAGFGRFMAIYVALVAILSITIFVFIANAGKVEVGIQHSMRHLAFENLQGLSFSYFDKNAAGWIIARLTSDIMKIGETVAWGLVDMVWGLSVMIGITFVMFATNWKLALITLSVVPLLVVSSRYFQVKMLKEYRNVRKINSKITGAFSEGILGARTSKTLVRESENIGEFKEITDDMRHTSIRAAIFSSLYLPIVITLGSIGTAMALNFGGVGVLSGAITYGTLVLFINYTVQFFEPVRELARVFSEMQSAQAAMERVISLIDEESEIKDKVAVISRYGDMYHPKRENWEEMHGDITFENVSFSYKDGERVLDGLNLDIRQGSTVALVGETGSGKTTIVNLISRFYEPTSGRILIDGKDYTERTQGWLHENIGYVLQSPQLFSGTILDNILYGKTDASEKEAVEAAKIVNAHNFIMKMEKGYETEVGEGGVLLSSGEKQLISFARAILADPKLFVLDEATSSVDTETEAIIQNAITKVLEGRTSFVIAHRLSTIRNADRILVVEKGHIIEDGDHDHLMKKKGHYYNLYKHQLVEDKEKMAMGTI